ncbi:MAG: tetratricopeptide repeat protein, partial [Myxococcota bacterium]
MRSSSLIFMALLVGCAGKNAPESAPSAATSADGSPVVQLSVDERISKAAALLTTGQPQHAQEAIAELQPLLIEEPTRVEIPYNMALAYHQLNDGLNARKFYLRSTAIEPSLGSAWLNLGALSEKEGQYRKALQHYRAGLQNAPEMGELVVGVIATLRRMGRHDEAIREAKTALSRDANNIDVFNNLGLVYIDKGQPDLALFIYQKALNTIDGADDNATLHANLGRAYLAKDRSANAKQELDRALALDPNLVAAMMYLAQLAMDDHDWDKTARLLERAVELDGENPAIHINLGIAYRGLGQYELARTEYETALKLDPENPDPYINIGLLLGEHVKDFAGGIAAIQTYRSRGGAHRKRADDLLTEFQKRKKKYEDDIARKSKREADNRKREEEARLAAEYEAMQEQWRKEQEEKKKQEEAKKAAAAAAAAAALGGAGAAAGQGGAASPASATPPASSSGTWGA